MAAPKISTTTAHGDVLARVGKMLQDRPGAGRAMAALAGLLEKIEVVEQQRRALKSPPATILPARAKAFPLIPVLGRAAANIPQFWDEPDREGLTNQLGPAVAQLSEGTRIEARSRTLGVTGGRSSHVALVQLAEPVELAGLSIAEVIESAALVEKWPEAFALRIEGDSMHPVLEADDLVIVSPKAPAKAGLPAVVQLADQIGVTCKVYRQARGQVRLISANPAYRTTVHDKSAVVWALRVLARVRTSE